jgi:hypothetical protein
MSVPSLRMRGRLGWEVLAVMALKILGLTALYFLFFTPDLRPRITDEGVAWHLFTASAAPTISHDEGVR